MFFKNYDTDSKIYSDRINNTFTFTKEKAEKDTAYKVDIYWVWPKVADQLILPKDDTLLTNKEINRIVADDIIKNDYDHFLFIQEQKQLATMILR